MGSIHREARQEICRWCHAAGITDYGGAVSIAKPPAAQVTEASNALYRLLDNAD